MQCYGTDRVGYEDDLSAWGSVGSRLSKILTRSSSVLINLPVLKDHDGAGVTIALKNMYGAIHNPNKYHPNGCDPYVADLNMLPEIRSRMKLIDLRRHHRHVRRRPRIQARTQLEVRTACSSHRIRSRSTRPAGR